MTTHDQLAGRIDHMESKIDALIASVAEMKADVAATKEIVAAWKSVKLWAQFAKWLAGFVGAAGAAWLAMKGWMHK